MLFPASIFNAQRLYYALLWTEPNSSPEAYVLNAQSFLGLGQNFKGCGSLGDGAWLVEAVTRGHRPLKILPTSNSSFLDLLTHQEVKAASLVTI